MHVAHSYGASVYMIINLMKSGNETWKPANAPQKNIGPQDITKLMPDVMYVDFTYTERKP